MRIRTIKPGFFRHELLQDLEVEYPRQYIMLTFAGLLGLCDCNGVFYAKPRSIKLDVLPFIDYDLQYTLEILAENGFIELYQHEGNPYGYFPTFDKHQRLSGKEATASGKYPLPTEAQAFTDWEATGKQLGSNGEATGKQRGTQGKERKGKEGKGVRTHAHTREGSEPEKKISSARDEEKAPPELRGAPPASDIDVSPPPDALPDDYWMTVAMEMAAFYESEEGAGQWAMMCDAAGGYVDPSIVTTIWAGKHQDQPYVLQRWRQHTGKLTNWIRNEQKSEKAKDDTNAEYLTSDESLRAAEQLLAERRHLRAV